MTVRSLVQHSLPAATTDRIAGLMPAEAGNARPLGVILADLGLVLPDEIVLALYEQEMGDDRRIGQILVDQGWIDTELLELTVLLQQKERELGATHAQAPATVASTTASDISTPRLDSFDPAAADWELASSSLGIRLVVAALVTLLSLVAWLVWVSPPLIAP